MENVPKTPLVLRHDSVAVRSRVALTLRRTEFVALATINICETKCSRLAVYNINNNIYCKKENVLCYKIFGFMSDCLLEYISNGRQYLYHKNV